MLPLFPIDNNQFNLNRCDMMAHTLIFHSILKYQEPPKNNFVRNYKFKKNILLKFSSLK